MKIILIFSATLIAAVPTQASKIDVPAVLREKPSNPDQEIIGAEPEPRQATPPSQDAGAYHHRPTGIVFPGYLATLEKGVSASGS